MSRVLLILIAIPLFWSASAVAEIYKWRDANGAVHFSDKPPLNMSPATRLETRTDAVYENGTGSGGEMEGRGQAPVSAPAKAVTSRNAKVEVYLTSWCPWCKKTIEFFQSRGINVRSYDIEKDAAAARRKDRLDPRKGVPTTVVNGQVIHGYAPGTFENALKSPR